LRSPDLAFAPVNHHDDRSLCRERVQRPPACHGYFDPLAGERLGNGCPILPSLMIASLIELSVVY
jgi:hypothetical protein